MNAYTAASTAENAPLRIATLEWDDVSPATYLPAWVSDHYQSDTVSSAGQRPSDDPPIQSTLLTVDQAAAYLAVCSKTVRRRIADGDLRARRIGRAIRIDHEDLKTF